MLKQNHSDESSIRNNQNVHEPDPAMDKSNSDLLREIDEMMEATDAEQNLDTDKLKHYLDILQSRSPVAEEYVPGEIWTELQEKMSADAAKDMKSSPYKEGTLHVFSHDRKKIPIGFKRFALSAAGVMLVLMFTANAFGYNPIKAFLEWAGDVVQVYGNPSGHMELPNVAPGEYHSLEEALEAADISTDGCPTWIPADFSITGVNIQTTGIINKYSAVYEGARGELLIRVMDATVEDWMMTAEKEDGGYIYEHNGVEYYIVSNAGQSKAGWQSGKHTYLIKGRIAEKELKTILNSIS